MKKIIVVDDTKENLTAARKAAKKFDGCQFVFLNNATKALEMIRNGKDTVDGVITDIFFPKEESVERRYHEEYMNIYDSCKHWDNPYKERVWKTRFAMTDVFRAYGGLITLQCYKLGIPVSIITEMHRHVIRDDSNFNRSVDATSVLSPLIQADFITMKDVINNEHHERYTAGPYVNKTEPEFWEKAINKCLIQNKGNLKKLATKMKELEEERERKRRRKATEPQRIKAYYQKFLSVFSRKKCGFKINNDLKKQLLSYMRPCIKIEDGLMEAPYIIIGKTKYYIEDIRIQNQNIAFILLKHNIRGYCKYDELRIYCFFHGQKQEKTIADYKYNLNIPRFGEIKTSEDGIWVELKVWDGELSPVEFSF